MKALRKIGLLLLATCLYASCANYNLNIDDANKNWSENPQPAKKLDFKVYLIGDAGAATKDKRNEALELLRQALEKASKQSAVIFLGNNAIPDGLPSKKDKQRERAEQELKAQLDILKDYKGQIVFLPGNYDWGANGVDGLRRQQKFIEEYLGRNDVFLPGNGCSGPTVKDLTAKLGLLVLDSQWYLNEWDNVPELNESCDIQNRSDFFEEAQATATDYVGKNLLVVAHHPLYSNGWYSDQFALKNHLYPPSDQRPLRHVPMPLMGTAILAADKLSANRQELQHPIYQGYISGIKGLARQHGNIIYAAGHEHNLQLQVEGEMAHIISGAGSLVSPVKLGKSSQMSYAGGLGFAVVDFYEDGEAWVEFIRPKEQAKAEETMENGGSPSKQGVTIRGEGGPNSELPKKRNTKKRLTSEVFYRQKIKEALPTPKEIIPKTFPEYKAKEDSVEVSILQKGEIWEMSDLIWGKLYTDYYYEKLKVPVLDLGKQAGGLKAFKKGGGFQSISIRLLNDKGNRFYQIRGIKKTAEKLFYPFNKTFAKNILEHSYTASNPFAAFLLKPMEEAIGIYHTNPSLVYVPQQPRLGIYNEYGGRLFLFEERPDDDWSNLASLGNSEKIVSTGKLIEERMKNDKAVIDQKLMMRSRLFDIIIGDWDRHADQWRWATKPVEGTEKVLFQPIPRDRDQAFCKYGGLTFYTARMLVPKFRSVSNYDGKLNKWETKWLTNVYSYLDHFTLNELTWEDWQIEVKYVQAHLTDASIALGMQWLPPGINEKMAPSLIKHIKMRRDNLMQTARWWHENLAHTASAIATQKENLIRVERLSNKETKVTIYEKGKDNDLQLVYQRSFDNEVTKEIRIFGLEGDDEFIVVGKVERSPVVRLIGGVDEDRFTDESKVSGLGKKTIVHDDRMEGNKVEPSSETKDFRMNDYERNTWFFRDNPTDYVVGVPIIGYNPDEQLFLGASLKIVRSHYRSKNIHQVAGQVAFSTKGYYFRYIGDYQRLLRKKDLLVEASLETPRYVNNFYGLGNDTKRLEDAPRNFYRVQMERYNFSASVKHLTDGGLLYSIGPLLKAVKVNFREGSFLDLVESEIRPEVFGNQYFGGLKGKLEYTNVDKKFNPSSGVDFKSYASWQTNIETPSMNYANLGGYLSLYIPMDRGRRFVVATRVGGSHNIGDFDFFNAPTLGGSQSDHLGGHLTIRGFNSGRFTGRSVFYHNTDLRLTLFDQKSIGKPLSFGIVPAFDYGRVWSDGEQSDTWHYSYGGGIWVAPLDLISIAFSLMKSEEGQRFTAALGYDF
jgi:Calcineurin-like phosphoesterase/Omp85 superfamily domain